MIRIGRTDQGAGIEVKCIDPMAEELTDTNTLLLVIRQRTSLPSPDGLKRARRLPRCLIPRQ